MPSDAALSPAPTGRNNGGKMQKLLKSAFKRGDSPAQAAGEEPELSPSASRGSGSGSGRTSSGRRVGRGDDVGDRSSRESVELDAEGSKNDKMLAALRDWKIASAYETFPWEKKMKELLPVPESSRFLSLLLLPKATDGTHTRYNTLDDTLARADAWLASSRASGVPVELASVQTEALLTKISGETAVSTVNMGSLSDLANMSNVSLYGFEDYHGVDIGVVRAVRLWYAPSGPGGEMAVEIALRQGDTRLGFAISRTEEGFIYVSSVADESTPGVASTRSGLLELHRAARRAGRLLVVSRVGGEKVLPWMVSTAGDVRCYDTVSLSQKLSLHRHALRPITLHFLTWDEGVLALPPPPAPGPLLMLSSEGDDEEIDGDGPEIAAGNGGKGSSFRFQNIGLPDSWL
ncbi:hypothetical protein ACQJBY_048936 [Aegilops geniculata]